MAWLKIRLIAEGNLLAREKGKTSMKNFFGYGQELEKAIGGCKSVLDIGCGAHSPIKAFSGRFYSVGVDIHEPSIKESAMKKIHNGYHVMDILNIGKKFRQKSFDCVVCLDVIEHFTKEDGKKLIVQMEQISIKKTIIVTPSGFLRQEQDKDNLYQEHKSGWTAGEMRSLGYKVVGISGLKYLRGEYGNIRLRPGRFWLRVSKLTQTVVRFYPELSFHLLSVKKFN